MDSTSSSTKKSKTISIRNLDPEERKKWSLKMNERKKEMKELKALREKSENMKVDETINNDPPPPVLPDAAATTTAAAPSATPSATPAPSTTSNVNSIDFQPTDTFEEMYQKLLISKQFDPKQLNEIRKLHKTNLKIQQRKNQIQTEKELYKNLHYDKIMDKINDMVEKRMEDLESRLITLGELKEDEIQLLVEEDLSNELKSKTPKEAKEKSLIQQYLKKKFDPSKITKKNGFTGSNPNKTNQEEFEKSEKLKEKSVQKQQQQQQQLQNSNKKVSSQQQETEESNFDSNEEFKKRNQPIPSITKNESTNENNRYKSSFVKPLIVDQMSIKSCF